MLRFFLSKTLLLSINVDFIFFNENLLEMMNNSFYFILKAIWLLKYSNFYPYFFGHVGKCLDKKVMVNFKICDVTKWETNNYETHVAQYLKK